MSEPRVEQGFGRPVIDDVGFRQHPVLRFFGAPFALAWSELTAWARAEAVVVDLLSGAERVDRRILELRGRGVVHQIVRRPGDPAFDAIVDELRQRAPGLETRSLLESL